MTARKFDADILGRLSEATADELTAALAAIREDFGAIRNDPATQETRDAVFEMRDAVTKIRAEETRRQTLADEHAAALADLSEFAEAETPAANASDSTAPGDATDSTATQEAAEAQHGTQDVEKLANPAGENSDDNSNDEAGTDGAGQEGEGDAVTASARRPLGGTQSNAGTPAPPLPQVQYRTTASAGLDTHAPGARLSRQELLRAFSDKLRSTRGAHGSNGYERYTVATRRAEFPEARTLVAGGDPEVNMQRVEDAVREARSLPAMARAEDQHALVAAGLCAPLENLYDIRTIGDADRPVRDALVRFGTDRGGVQYRPALRGVTQTGGIGFWGTDEDEADPIVPKTCVEIDCPGLLTAEVEAIYQCLTFSNMSTRFDPEFMDSVVRAQEIAHARIAENWLLNILTTASKSVYSQQLLGAVRDILATLDKVIAYYRNVHRISRETPLRWIAPVWALNLMRADMTRQMVGDGMQVMALTDEQIVSWFRARNVNPTFHLDGIDPADITTPDPDVVVPAQAYTLLTTGSMVPDFPTALSTLLFAEGDWSHLDGGTLDMGVVRDSTLNAQNRFQTFQESFEYPFFRGVESLHLVIPALPNGQSAATVDTTGDAGI